MGLPRWFSWTGIRLAPEVPKAAAGEDQRFTRRDTQMPRQPALDEALWLLRAEYRDLPGLSLTQEQARRLCHRDGVVSARALAELVRSGVLTRRDDGHFVLTATLTRA